MSSDAKLWYLENINLFKGLSQPEMMEVEQKTIMKTFPKSDYIYFPDEPSKVVFFLKTGRVKLGTYTDDGKEVIKAILQPGEVFGEMAVTGEEKRTDYAMALDNDTRICAMSVEDITSMMEKNSALGLKVTKLIGFRLRKIERRFEALIGKDARSRIVDFLKEMAEEIGKNIGTEVMIKHHLTHNDIANLTATSRQTVTTVLNELRDKNLIYFERKKMLIRDINQLK